MIGLFANCVFHGCVFRKNDQTLSNEVNKMNRLMSVSQVMLFTKSSKLSLKSLLTIMNPILLYPILSALDICLLPFILPGYFPIQNVKQLA